METIFDHYVTEQELKLMLPRVRTREDYKREVEVQDVAYTHIYKLYKLRGKAKKAEGYADKIQDKGIRDTMKFLRGLLIRSPWIEEILEGRKTWEIRGSNTIIRDKFALIRSGSGLIVGTCELIDVKGPLTLSEMQNNVDKHGIPLTDLKRSLYYDRTYAWVLSNAKALKKPIPYKHPCGAIIWVMLPSSVTGKLLD